MENHLKFTVDTSRYVNLNPDGSPTGPVEVTDQYSTGDQVVGYLLVKGDKKSPTNFSYEAFKENYWRGSVRFYHKFNNKWYISATRDGAIYTLIGPNLSTRAWSHVPQNADFHYNRALSRLNEKVRGGLDLSVSLLEGAEVKKMLLSAHKASNYIGNTIKGVKRGHKSDLIKDILKDSGGSYLQWHLGWDPLIKDLYATVGEVYRHLTDGLMDVSGSSTEKLPVRIPLDKRVAHDPQEYAKAIGKQGCRFHMRFKDKGGFNVSRYTSLNPASILWERLPLSFVFDYFYDLGGLLRATETACLYDNEFVSGYYTELTALDCVSEPGVVVVYKGDDNYVEVDAASHFKFVKFKRTVLGSYPLPRLPSFRVDLGSSQLLTIASLLAQKFL